MIINDILKYLPHRYPLLLVDRVLTCEPKQSLTAIKNVTINEPFFIGHFPEQPIMPGVLILEALAQASALLAFNSLDEAVPPANLLLLFAGIDKARFKRTVIPGDQLHLQVTLLKQKRNIWMFEGSALVEQELAASAELMCAVTENNT